MGWELTIHTIDVGQGESSLIVVKHDGAIVRTMLIDGGLQGAAASVNAYLDHWNISSVDVVVVSHYDDDHSGGIIELLKADNIEIYCKEIAQHIYDNIIVVYKYAQSPYLITAVAAGMCALLSGAYDYEGNNVLCVMKGAITYAINCIQDWGVIVDAYVVDAIKNTENYIKNWKREGTARYLNSRLFFKNMDVIYEVSKRVNRDINVDQLYIILYQSLGIQNAGGRIRGKFKKSIVIDTGDDCNMPGDYESVACGFLPQSSVKVPWVNTRKRVTPEVGTEVFSSLHPAEGCPVEIYVMAINRCVWPRKHIDKEEINANYDCIGLVLRFGSFYYYTGGDLPSEGEDKIAASIMNDKLQHRLFPVPTQGITAFKCGHHGSHYSTSQYFLRTLRPKVALISCGEKGEYDHPHQRVITDLYRYVLCFFLTGCPYEREGIPATFGDKIQLGVPGNKAFVAGGTGSKGHIVFSIRREDQELDPGPILGVTYYEWDMFGGRGGNITWKIEW